MAEQAPESGRYAETEQSFPEKRVLLWAHPRAISTACEVAMMQRDDTEVISEPLIDLYYSSDERCSERFLPPDPGNIRYSFRALMAQLLAPSSKKIVWSKNMAYYVNRRRMNPDMLSNFQNTFIMREPSLALASHYKIDPGFNLEEAGYFSLKRMFDMVTTECGQKPVVLEGTTLRQNPEGIMRSYCDAIEIPFDPKSLHWETGKKEKLDRRYDRWITQVEQSTGFIPPEESNAPELPTRILKMIDECRPHYEYLLRFALKPMSPPANSKDTLSARA